MNDSFIPAARAAAGRAGRPGGTPARRSSRPENGRGRLGTAATGSVEAS
ncbi:hypothetical protein [Streptosporangium sp. NPDC048865]